MARHEWDLIKKAPASETLTLCAGQRRAQRHDQEERF
jgi:hypothetical protein